MFRLVVAPILVLLAAVPCWTQLPAGKPVAPGVGKGKDAGKTVPPAVGKEKPGAAKGEKKIPTTRDLFRWLEEPLDMKPYQSPMTLKEALGLFTSMFAAKGKDLPLLVDVKAFLEENPDATDIYDTQVKLPPFPRRMPLKQALHFAVSQIPTDNGSFLVRKGVIEITTVERAHRALMVDQVVRVTFDKRPLAEALEELSDLTGIPIVLDPRLGEKAQTPVSARFGNGVTLGMAVELLTEMAGVRVRFEVAEVEASGRMVLFITEAPKAAGKQKGELRLRNRPLARALEELAEWSGTSIVLDPRARMMGMRPFFGMPGMPGPQVPEEGGPSVGLGQFRVSATFRAGTSPRAAAKILASLTGLDAVFIDNAIFVTNREVAAEMGVRPAKKSDPKAPPKKPDPKAPLLK